MGRYYGVSQSNHGHEYRWIFEKDVIEQEIGHFPENETADVGFPIGGSNSSATCFQPLENDSEIKAFLLAPALGPDLEDPALIDIAEYLLTVDIGSGSCTQEFLDKFGLNLTCLTQYDDTCHHLCEAEKMAEALLSSGEYDDVIDKESPFYGFSRDLRFSELCAMYEGLQKEEHEAQR